MAVAVTSQFIRPAAPLFSALTLGAVFLVIGLASAATWAVLGRAITRWLTEAHHLRRFNLAMAAVIAASVLILFLE